MIRDAIVLDLSLSLIFLWRRDVMIYISSFWDCFKVFYDTFLFNLLMSSFIFGFWSRNFYIFVLFLFNDRCLLLNISYNLDVFPYFISFFFNINSLFDLKIFVLFDILLYILLYKPNVIYEFTILFSLFEIYSMF